MFHIQMFEYDRQTKPKWNKKKQQQWNRQVNKVAHICVYLSIYSACVEKSNWLTDTRDIKKDHKICQLIHNQSHLIDWAHNNLCLC